MTEKPENQTSDEALVVAFLAGDLPDRQAGQTALDILYQRYYEHLYYFIVDQTLIHESSFIEDIRQEVFLKIFQLIKSEVFDPRGKGSFKAYLFATAKNICRNSNYWRNKEPKDIYGRLLELIPARPMIDPQEKEVSQARLKARLVKVLARLSPEEQKLLAYLTEDTEKHPAGTGLYKRILADPLFAEFSLASLKDKIYNTRQKAQRLFDKEAKDEQEEQ